MNEKAQALLAMKDIIDRITLVAKDGGRESGLTSGDRAQIMAATQVVAKALDEGGAAAARVTELETKLAEFETNLKERDDKYAGLTGELDQLKAELDRIKSGECFVHKGGVVKDGARMHEKDEREQFAPANGVSAGSATKPDPQDSRHE